MKLLKWLKLLFLIEKKEKNRADRVEAKREVPTEIKKTNVSKLKLKSQKTAKYKIMLKCFL